MSDKIAKLLSKLSKSDLRRIQQTLNKIDQLEFEGLDIETLKGNKNVFRVRIGVYRIVFTINKGKRPNIISIACRSEKTYKDF